MKGLSLSITIHRIDSVVPTSIMPFEDTENELLQLCNLKTSRASN
jgi:hypothetical protein